MRITLLPNFEVIAPARLASALVDLLERNMLVRQILLDKPFGALNYLTLVLNAKDIIAISQRKEEGGATTSQRIKYTQSLLILLSISACEECNVEQDMRK